MGVALAGGRRRHQSVPPRACGLLREAGKWTVTDRLTHVSSGDLSPSGPTERTGAGLRSDGRGGTRAGLLSPVCPGLRTREFRVMRSLLYRLEWSGPTGLQSRHPTVRAQGHLDSRNGQAFSGYYAVMQGQTPACLLLPSTLSPYFP